jgi:CheY-like chemotaxis protein
MTAPVRILIVDDNPSNTKLPALLLSSEGYLVHTAANADEARLAIDKRQLPIDIARFLAS